MLKIKKIKRFVKNHTTGFQWWIEVHLEDGKVEVSNTSNAPDVAVACNLSGTDPAITGVASDHAEGGCYLYSYIDLDENETPIELIEITEAAKHKLGTNKERP